MASRGSVREEESSRSAHQVETSPQTLYSHSKIVTKLGARSCPDSDADGRDGRPTRSMREGRTAAQPGRSHGHRSRENVALAGRRSQSLPRALRASEEPL